ncbi:hypothetical protein ERD95_15340 [Enterobacteriaceae bacterium ML5]|nr:hypothetical protein ERD95_15340 [Enterobacteriaceae bacterium ML5]
MTHTIEMTHMKKLLQKHFEQIEALSLIIDAMTRQLNKEEYRLLSRTIRDISLKLEEIHMTNGDTLWYEVHKDVKKEVNRIIPSCFYLPPDKDCDKTPVSHDDQ